MTDLLLVPIELPRADGLLPGLGRQLEPVFRVRARIVELELDVEACRSATRNQYDTRALLSLLSKVPEPGLVLGVTDKDLFLPVFTFVIGEAYLGGRAAVVSTYRLREESYGMPPNPRLFTERLLKEAVHEVGHCRGLVHCSDPRCVMHASSTAEDVDLKSSEMCLHCHRQLSGKKASAQR